MSGALRRLSMGLRTASIPTRNRTVEWAKEWADTDEATKEAVQVAGTKLRASGMVRMHLGDDCIRGAAYIAGLRPVAWGPSYPQGTLAPSLSFPAVFLPFPFSYYVPPLVTPHPPSPVSVLSDPLPPPSSRAPCYLPAPTLPCEFFELNSASALTRP